ncbi:MAG: Ran-binding zinc finger domain-containing protein [Actinomycetota bacterium]
MLSDDLFQPLVLGLLGVTVLLLLGLLSALGSLKRTLAEGRTDSIGSLDAAGPQSDLYSGAAAPGYAQPTAAATPQPGAQGGDVADTGTGASTATAPQATGTGSVPQAAAAETGFEGEPEEQPFERDGRWYFKRGRELLVYEDQTGQWVPAPTAEGAAAQGGAAGEPAGASGYLSGLAASAAPETQEQLPPQGSFWKCPSCGAVNGSTADTCRMCFTTRP